MGFNQHLKNQRQKALQIKVVKQSQKGTKIRIRIKIKKKKRKRMFHLKKFLKVPKREIIEKMTEAEKEEAVETVETEVMIDVTVGIENTIETGIQEETEMHLEIVLWTDMEIQKNEVEIQEEEGIEIGIKEWNRKEKKWNDIMLDR